VAASSTGSSEFPGRMDGRSDAEVGVSAGSGDPAAVDGSWRWRVLPDDGERRPRLNLAREEALSACSHGVPTLRLWRNDRCVVVGRAQIVGAETDAAACREFDIPVLRRFTGGGAVFHDPGNLNVSVIAARDDAAVRAALGLGLAGLYALVLGPLAQAVRALAGGATNVTTDERAAWIGDGKVSGVAAWLGSRAVLVHATLLVDSDLALLERALAGPGAPGNARWEHTRSRRVRVTSLAREGLATNPDTVDAAVIAAFTGEAGGTGAACATAGDLFTPEEQAATAGLLAERYERPEWHLEGKSRTA
jgi:lipoate---protein ligase